MLTLCRFIVSAIAESQVPDRIKEEHLPTISRAQLRRHVVAWQGYASRYRQADAEDLLSCVRRLSCVQLDSIATVERSHLLVLGSRIGKIDGETVSHLLAGGKLFEYWAHEACLLPIEDYPLFRHRMQERQTHHWWGPVIKSDPRLAQKILHTIRERGPLGSRHFEGKGGGGMWNLKPAKRMLDALWTAGQLMVSGRQGFQRLYDLPERVIPPQLLSAPILSEEETLRTLLVRAVEARGALTAAGIRDHYRLSGGVARLLPQLHFLCSQGQLQQYTVVDDGPPVYFPIPSNRVRPSSSTSAVFLSPFENLLWDRDFARRVFGFDHRIEVYKREQERVYGYYVLPILMGDRLVGRADVKAHRAEGILQWKSFHLEPGVRRGAALADRLQKGFQRLSRTLGLNPRIDARID